MEEMADTEEARELPVVLIPDLVVEEPPEMLLGVWVVVGPAKAITVGLLPDFAGVVEVPEEITEGANRRQEPLTPELPAPLV